MELWKNGTLEKWRSGEMDMGKIGNWTFGKMVFGETGYWKKWKVARTIIWKNGLSDCKVGKIKLGKMHIWKMQIWENAKQKL